MSTNGSDKSPRRRRLKTPIQPIHVEELLAGAGMSGFLGVLDSPARTTHLEKLAGGEDTCLAATPRNAEPAQAAEPEKRYASTEMTARVASVVGKMKALTELIKVAAAREK